MIKYLLLNHIHITYYLVVFLPLIENFTNPPNLTTHLMVNSLKKIKESN